VKSSAFTCVHYCLTEGSIIPSFGFPNLMVIHGQLIPVGLPVPFSFCFVKETPGASLSLLARPRKQFSLNAFVRHELMSANVCVVRSFSVTLVTGSRSKEALKLL